MNKTGKGFAISGVVVSIVDIALGIYNMMLSAYLIDSIFSMFI